MRYLRLVKYFMLSSAQTDLAYRANLAIGLLNSLLNLIVGVLGLVVLFSQVKTLNGWTFASTLALLGVYLTISAVRGWFIGPSLEVLAGIEGDVWSGRFDFTLLRPINTQFFVSVRQWSWFAVIDLALGLGVIVVAALTSASIQSGGAQIFSFLIAAMASVAVLYAILLIFTALVFWSPGLLFTWVFDAIMQLARYPIGIYPGWLQFVLTWIIPVAIMTTIPAAALTGDIQPIVLIGCVALAVILFVAASILFHIGVKRYNSASS
jgi:ABC-2 type transport system permease protein